MPLSDREQRILKEIERQFYEDDPDFAASVSRTRFKGRRAASGWGVTGAALGLAVMLVAFTWNSFVALGGFALMAVSLAWTLTSLRRGTGTPRVRRWSFLPRRRPDGNG